MSTSTTTSPKNTDIPFEEREQALRRMRALLERMRNRLHRLSGKRKRRAQRAWKRVKRNRGRMKQAFYEVTLADQKKWKKVRPRIARTYREAERTLENA
jgi:hypothetical protein